MGQKIGTEGYGWIPRYYEGEKISYLLGDASNAYGKVTSPLWLERARLSGTQFTPENGWDENKVNLFRRHVIQLGTSGVYILYDELEGKEPVAWSFLLHTTEFPMDIQELPDQVIVKGKNTDGVSTAHLFCSEKTKQEINTAFFSSPDNWMNKTDKKGNIIRYPDHWHFSATTPKSKTVRFLTIIDTHGQDKPDIKIIRKGNEIQIDDWIIHCNLSNQGSAAIRVSNSSGEIFLAYDADKNEGTTLITDQAEGKTVKKILSDYLPDFEI
jgi:hypothetical protein